MVLFNGIEKSLPFEGKVAFLKEMTDEVFLHASGKLYRVYLSSVCFADSSPLWGAKIIKKLFLFLQIGCIIYKDYSADLSANCEGVRNR